MNICKACGADTRNPKYCSKSCSAKVNNRKPKRVRKIHYCDECGDECRSYRKYCPSCWKTNQVKDMTLQEAMYEHHHKSSAFAKVRTRARALLTANRPKVCQDCGYDKHVECCHIKGIASFPEDTLVSEVNDLSNLKWLCPNCHWEHDHHQK